MKQTLENKSVVKIFKVPRCFRWHWGWLGPLAAGLANPNGIPAPSPGLSRQRDYPGQAAAFLCNPNGVVPWGWAGQRAQPRWGWRSLRGIPKVARASQPWAGGRNPVGIEAAIPQPLKWSARFACHRKQRGTKSNNLPSRRVKPLRKPQPVLSLLAPPTAAPDGASGRRCGRGGGQRRRRPAPGGQSSKSDTPP